MCNYLLHKISASSHFFSFPLCLFQKYNKNKIRKREKMKAFSNAFCRAKRDKKTHIWPWRDDNFIRKVDHVLHTRSKYNIVTYAHHVIPRDESVLIWNFLRYTFYLGNVWLLVLLTVNEIYIYVFKFVSYALMFISLVCHLESCQVVPSVSSFYVLCLWTLILSVVLVWLKLK